MKKKPQARTRTLRLTLREPYLSSIEANAKLAGVGLVPYIVAAATNYAAMLSELTTVDAILEKHIEERRFTKEADDE